MSLNDGPYAFSNDLDSFFDEVANKPEVDVQAIAEKIGIAQEPVLAPSIENEQTIEVNHHLDVVEVETIEL